MRDADLVGTATEAEAYMRVAAERYRLIRAHEWNDDVIQQLRGRGGLSSERRRRKPPPAAP